MPPVRRFGIAGAVFAALLSAISPRSISADEPPAAADAAAPAAAADSLKWHSNLAAAVDDARKREVSILVRVGAEWCLWCRRLEKELAQPEVQRVLADWVLVSLDADTDVDEVRRLSVGPIPALRVLNSGGHAVRSHDGYLPAEQLLRWLKGQDESVDGALIDPVTEVAELSAETLPALVKLLGHRDAGVRETVGRRLAADRSLAAAQVVQAFARGGLAVRLAALEVLGLWKAPIEDFDPWRPQSITPARLNDLEDWAATRAGDGAAIPALEPLTAEETAEVRADIVRLSAADAAEAEAIGARLARFGARAISEVRQSREAAQTDKARERLDWLRFRLLASDALALKWSRGLIRLAATDARSRREAAGELSSAVTSGDEPLLIELLGHPDAFVRELSLKSLHEAGGPRAAGEVLRLLSDPEPNVRAAVLKQMAERPSAEAVPQIADYISRETDADLVVHAVRLLREIKGRAAVKCLTGLLEHQSWQVRAEAAETLGSFVDRHRHSSRSDSQDADIYTAMIDLLADPDGFVVSRAVSVLANADLIAAVDPLARAALAHPELAHEVLRTLAQGQTKRKRAMVHLHEFTSHADPKLRAAAIASLCELLDEGVEERLPTWLKDDDSEVRLAAAKGLFQMLVRERPDVAGGAPVDDRLALPLPIDVQAAAEAAPPPAAGGNTAAADADPTDGPQPDREALLLKIRDWKTSRDKRRVLVEALEPMLAGKQVEQQLEAALALAALGRDELAVPELLRLAESERRHRPRIAEALPWLLAADRAKLLKNLVAGRPSEEDLQAIAAQLAAIRTVQAGEDLWALLALPEIDVAQAETLRSSLLQFYFPRHYYDLDQATTAAKGRAVAAAKLRLGSAAHWQRMTAFSLLLPLEAEAIIEPARALLAHRELDAASQLDVFQALLIAEPEEQGTQDAVSQLLDGSAALRDVALAYLTGGAGDIDSLRDGRFQLGSSGHAHIFQFANTGQVLVPEPPAGLRAEPLLPLVELPNAKVAAQAGYLLALLERREGLARLIDYWRNNASGDMTWIRLVYRAIARLDDGAQLPVLKEIYSKLSVDEHRYYLGEFYWTLRGMTHPDILAFRRQIRQEVGMEQLR